MIMDWTYAVQKPEPVVRALHLGVPQRTVNFDIEQLGEEERLETGYLWRHRSVTLPPGVWTYDAVVSAIVRSQYPADRVEAIMANMQCDPLPPDAREELRAFQDWRVHAKEIARQALGL